MSLRAKFLGEKGFTGSSSPLEERRRFHHTEVFAKDTKVPLHLYKNVSAFDIPRASLKPPRFLFTFTRTSAISLPRYQGSSSPSQERRCFRYQDYKVSLKLQRVSLPRSKLRRFLFSIEKAKDSLKIPRVSLPRFQGAYLLHLFRMGESDYYLYDLHIYMCSLARSYRGRFCLLST
jgi:hypothetical protein